MAEFYRRLTFIQLGGMLCANNIATTKKRLRMSEWFIMTVKKFLLYIRFAPRERGCSFKKPLDISAARWYAMVQQYYNNKEAFENE